MITNKKKSKTRQFQCYNRTHSIALKRAECARQTVDRLGISCYAFASLPIQMINTFSRILSHSSKCYLPLLYIYIWFHVLINELITNCAVHLKASPHSHILSMPITASTSIVLSLSKSVACQNSHVHSFIAFLTTNRFKLH